MTPERHLEDLTVEECLVRLATQQLGRLAVVVDHYPHVFPVNYQLDDSIIVFRTREGGELLRAHHENVAFQVDHLDHQTRRGWTVLVLGMAEDVTDLGDDLHAERGRQLPIHPWAPGAKERIVRIIPAKISGRQLTGDPIWSLDTAGYL